VSSASAQRWRIACVLGAPPTARTLAGGDRHEFEVWQRWAARPDVEMHVVACWTGAQLAERLGYRIPCTLTESRASGIGALRLGYLARCVRALRRLPEIGQLDAVYAGSPFFYDVLPAVAAKIQGRARRIIVPFYHVTPPPTTRTGNPLANVLAWVEQRIMLRLIARYADTVLVAYAGARDDLIRNGVAPQAIVTTGMGAREGLAAKTPPEYDAICIGRFTPAKGIVTLLEAWAQVQRALPGARLALVGGDMPGFDIGREIARRSLAPCVCAYLGPSDQDVRELVSASRIFITASNEEGYGLAVGEALAAGLPCVTFDVPAFAAVFELGRHTAPGESAQALAQAALEVLTDEALYARLHDEARSWRYPSWDEVADALWSECLET
jgi:glycosyltransferase involved in cell wall biosynthesis